MKINILIFLALFSFLFASCAPKEIKFYVTRPSEFKIENVKYIETGKFVSASGTIETSDCCTQHRGEGFHSSLSQELRVL